MTFQLTLEEVEFLVRLARRAIEEYLKKEITIEVPEETPPKLLEQYGVFITLYSIKRQKKELRGCIGFPYPTIPLVQAVIKSAINSAAQDPRFNPVSLEELDRCGRANRFSAIPQLFYRCSCGDQLVRVPILSSNYHLLLSCYVQFLFVIN